MEAIESEVKKLIDSGFIRKELHPNWVVNIVPVPKKNEKIQICIDYRDLNVACSKDKFSLPIMDVTIRAVLRGCLLWMISQGIIKKMYPEDEKHTSFKTPLGVYCYTVLVRHIKAVWMWSSMSILQDHRMLCWWYRREKPWQRWLSRRPEESVWHHAGLPVEDEPNQVLPGIASGKFFGFVVTSKDSPKFRESMCHPRDATFKKS